MHRIYIRLVPAAYALSPTDLYFFGVLAFLLYIYIYSIDIFFLSYMVYLLISVLVCIRAYVFSVDLVS